MRHLATRLRSRLAVRKVTMGNVISIKTGIVQQENAEVLERMKGVEAFTVTPILRFNEGVLEQMWQGSSGRIRWDRVKDKGELSGMPFVEA